MLALYGHYLFSGILLYAKRTAFARSTLNSKNAGGGEIFYVVVNYLQSLIISKTNYILAFSNYFISITFNTRNTQKILQERICLFTTDLLLNLESTCGKACQCVKNVSFLRRSLLSLRTVWWGKKQCAV